MFKPHGIVLEEAHAVGAELGLPPWWLNEQASSYVAPERLWPIFTSRMVYQHPLLHLKRLAQPVFRGDLN